MGAMAGIHRAARFDLYLHAGCGAEAGSFAHINDVEHAPFCSHGGGL